MLYYCPQCGTKVLQGATVCPQCGTQLKFVIQTGGTDNNLGSTLKNPPMKKRNAMGFTNGTDDVSGFNTESGPILKYNDFANNPNKDDNIPDNDDMSIIGLDSQILDDYDNDFQQDKQYDMDIQNKTAIGNLSTNMAKGSVAGVTGDLSKYKIVTQVFDKKIGFDAAELEEKLNMYAKLGYHLVPNTMICQPGQDFFALMERTVPDNTKPQPQPINMTADKAEAKKDEQL